MRRPSLAGLAATMLVVAVCAATAVAQEAAVVVSVEVRQDVRITSPGRPLPEAWVAVVAPGEGPREAAAHAVSTDQDGRAHVVLDNDEWDGGAVVLVWKDAFAPVAFWADDADRELVPLEPARSLEARVAVRSGVPLPEARVEVSVELPVLGSPPSSREFQTIRFDALTDAHGGCLFDGLPDAAATVRATAEDFVPADVYPAVPGAAPARLVMRRGAGVSGSVRLIPSGRSAAGAAVVLGALRATVAEDGTFELRGIPPGEHELRVEGSKIVSPPARLLVLSEGEQRRSLDLRVVVAARLPGRLRDAEGRRVGEALVSVLWPRRTGLDERDAGDAQIHYDVVTDDLGGFLIEALRPADGVVIEVRAPGYAPQLIEGLSLPAGGAARLLDVVLEPGGEMTGVVRGANGVPIAGARVEARPAGDGRGRPAASWSATGGDGAFVLDGLPDGPLGLVVIPPAASSAREGSFGPFFGGGDEPEHVGELSLGVGHVLRGRVTGAPAGTVLSATTEDGAFVELALDDEVFEIAGLLAGDVSLVATSDRAPGGAWGHAEVPSGWPVALRWVAAREIAVHIVDPLGSPVPAVGFHAAPVGDAALPSLEASARAPDGTFTFDLEPGRWRLSARSGPLFGRVEVEVPADGPVAQVTLRLERGETVRGEVGSLLTGGVIEGARVEVIAVGSPDAALPATSSGPRGRFEVPGVPAGVVRLRVTAAGHAPLETRARVVERASSLDVGRLELGAGTRLVGRVWSAAGTPARGLVFTFEHDDGTVRDTRTDLYGRFEIAALPTGGGRLVHGSTIHRVELPPRPEVEIEVDLAAGTRLEGVVTSAGRATAYARVVAWTLSEPAALAESRTDAHGRFALALLPAGPTRIEVAPPGDVPPWQTDVVLSGGAVDNVELTMPEGWIAGFVIEDDGGTALGGALVRLVEIDADGNVLRDAGGAATDSQGRFRVEGVAPGRYEVEARRDGSGSAVTRGLAVVAGGLDDVLLRLPREASIEVEIVDERGRPVAGAWVAAARLERDPLGGARALADLRGRAALAGLAPGLWEVAVGADGRGHVELGTVRLSEGALDLGRVMLRAAGALRVAVVHPGYLPAGGAPVSVVDAFDRDPRSPAADAGSLFGGAREHVTDADGILLVSELSPGVYFVYSDAAPDQTVAVQVEPGDVAEVVLLAPWPAFR